MIEVKNVVKTFDGFTALDGATITVPGGGVYGLVGPNGAGKSTLIRCLTGVYRQDEGMPKRRSHESPVVKEVYENYLGEPGGHKAHELLHCTYVPQTRYRT